MLLKSLSLLIPLGQAAQILKGSYPHVATSGEMTIQSTRVNGTLTSFSVTEGNGCPSGTYQAQPIEPGTSLNTYVDFDAGIYLYNSTTSPAPVTCTLSIDYEFTYPEGGQAEIILESITYNDARFEEGDVARETNFDALYDLNATAGDDGIDGPLKVTRIIDEGPTDFKVGAGLYPVGTPGEIGVGTFQVAISLSTSFGPGEFSVSRVDIGFGLYETAPED